MGELTPPFVDVAELVDALGLGSSGFGRGGSSPPVGTVSGSCQRRMTGADPPPGLAVGRTSLPKVIDR